MRKQSILTITLGCLLALSIEQANGSVLGYPFRTRVQKSDLIVEGIVEEQLDIEGYNRHDIQCFTKKSLIKVTEVYKGSISKGDEITVFSHRNFACDTSRRLKKGGRFLLMLKRHEGAFSDVNHGNGMWEIFTLETNKLFMINELGSRKWGQPYEQFKYDLAWVMSKPPSWPQEPTLSLEQAQMVALETLFEANVDMKGFELTKQELLNIGSEMIGIAHKGDPMWLFQWRKPEAKNHNPMPYGTFLYCYVHAHTGKLRCGPPPLGRTTQSLENLCRFFLKTDRRYHQTYADCATNIRIIQLKEEEFRNLVPRLENAILDVKLSYPEGTTFLKVEFPDSASVDPVVFAIKPYSQIGFAAIVRPETHL